MKSFIPYNTYKEQSEVLATILPCWLVLTECWCFGSDSSSSGSESGSSSSSTSTDSDQETKIAKKNRKKASSGGGLFLKATGLANRPGQFLQLGVHTEV